MFDISWTEFLLIGVVALVVIGPKELPGVLRTLGQWTRKVRSMAADFQNQFQEAMREAEMADLKKQVDDMAHDFKNIDPLKGVRADVEAAGRDIEQSLKASPDTNPVLAVGQPAATDIATSAPAAASDHPSLPDGEAGAAAPVGPVVRSDLEAVGADETAKTPAAAAATDRPDSAGHSE